ncbi:unannotated protein [freshwater metagenome]|uniref:Unannotated protein n=1 Tax=freshwater metagenome TaxID=449393 RepID=A0A6J7C7G4_9ZZZZ
MGVDDGLDGEPVRGERRTGVEPDPTEPQDAGAEDRERQVVRRHRFLPVTAPHTDDQHHGECSGAGIDVDDSAAGEVERTAFEQPAGGAEHPVGDDRVDDDRPHADEDRVGTELQAVSRGPRDQRWGDDGEHHLVRHEQQRRDDQCERPGVAGQRIRFGNTLHPRKVEVADEPVLAAERQREADRRPEHADEPHREHVLHEHAEDVLAAHHAAIEERESRCHEQHERCRNDHPRGGAGVNGHLKDPFG